MPFNQIVKKLILNPKKLFLLDGFGALLSAFLLGVILVSFESTFGIPKKTLYLLASFPCFFAVYDFYCYYIIKKNIGFFLITIACVNVLYCFLSIGCAIYHKHTITYFGLVYITLEILIVISLIIVELRAVKKLNIT